MIGVNQCWCGCSLQKGTLILLWLSLIVGIYSTYFNLRDVLHAGELHLSFDQPLRELAIIERYIWLLSSIACIATAAVGIGGIRKNKPKRLTPYLYYTGFSIVYHISVQCTLIFHESMYDIVLNEVDRTVERELRQYTFSFEIAVGTCLFIAVKRCRDSMSEKAAAADGNNLVVQA